MSYSNISASLSQQDVTDIKAAIKTIETKLPFLVVLTPDEKNSLFKLGSKSVDFVDGALNASKNFPDIFPKNFNPDEFEKDALLFKTLSDITQPLASLSQKLDDTFTAVGSEALGEALQVYSYVQTAAPVTPGLKPIAEQLQERFKRQSGKKAAVPPTAKQ
jgi:hypothetical protein